MENQILDRLLADNKFSTPAGMVNRQKEVLAKRPGKSIGCECDLWVVDHQRGEVVDVACLLLGAQDLSIGDHGRIVERRAEAVGVCGP